MTTRNLWFRRYWWVFLVIGALLLGAWYGWETYQRNRTIQNELENVRENVIQLEKALTEKTLQVEKELKAVQREAREVGDKVVQEMSVITDSDFLRELNDYSELMVERVRGSGADNQPLSPVD